VTRPRTEQIEVERAGVDAAEPAADASPVLYLLDASSSLERRLLADWIGAQPKLQAEGSEAGRSDAKSASEEVLLLPPSRRPAKQGKVATAALDARLRAGDDPLLSPLRVAWLPARNDATPLRRMWSLVVFGDPSDPGRLRQWWLSRRRSERFRVIVGEPARLSELRSRWRQAAGAGLTDTAGLAEFVVRQAMLALERAERRVRGMRYKVPRFVHESILERPAFQATVARLAWELGADNAEIAHEASEDLREIAATHSPYVIDMAAQFCRLLYTRGYARKLDYDRGQLERVYALAQRHPVVFLPSHKSNLDHLVLQYALYENGHPPNHAAGGDNMNFFPVGPLLRRSGLFFIRRTFKDNPVYKAVLGHYVDYLVEKRFPLEWYIEGGRSRSGKLLPPRFGMLAYVLDAYRRGKSEDVFLLPVSIAYDQIQDVTSYVAEQRGEAKEPEGFRWFLRVLRSLSRRYGSIHIRMGEPLSLREVMGPAHPGRAPGADERSLELQKLAFEISARINRATPITPTSLVTLAMLATGDRALTLVETVEALQDLVAYVEARNLPMTEPVDLEDPGCVQTTLDHLVENGVVSAYSGGPEAVYAIGADQHLTAAYYRNSVIHFFLTGAITQLAAVRASEEDVEDASSAFWAETLALRDLLKFEFFFSDKDAFRGEIETELAFYDDDWREVLAGGQAGAVRLLHQFRPFSAHLVIRPFVEAYSVVADALVRFAPGEFVDQERFLRDCLGLGWQYHLQRRLRSAESVSKVLFATALRLADNRRLVRESDAGVAERRRAFAAELQAVIRRIDAVEYLAAGPPDRRVR